jgi:hypothetical protein
MSKNKRFTVTKKEKQAKIALVMREFASGKLTSGGKPLKAGNRHWLSPLAKRA